MCFVTRRCHRTRGGKRTRRPPRSTLAGTVCSLQMSPRIFPRRRGLAGRGSKAVAGRGTRDVTCLTIDQTCVVRCDRPPAGGPNHARHAIHGPCARTLRPIALTKNQPIDRVPVPLVRRARGIPFRARKQTCRNMGGETHILSKRRFRAVESGARMQSKSNSSDETSLSWRIFD